MDIKPPLLSAALLALSSSTARAQEVFSQQTPKNWRVVGVAQPSQPINVLCVIRSPAEEGKVWMQLDNAEGEGKGYARLQFLFSEAEIDQRRADV